MTTDTTYTITLTDHEYASVIKALDDARVPTSLYIEILEDDADAYVSAIKSAKRVAGRIDDAVRLLKEKRVDATAREAQRLIETLEATHQRFVDARSESASLDREIDRLRDEISGYCEIHQLCTECGLRSLVPGWDVSANCPEHTVGEDIHYAESALGFDVDAWCASHGYRRIDDGYQIVRIDGI